MDTLQCAVLLGKFDTFQWAIDRRMAAGDIYLDLLSGAHGVRLPVVRPENTCVWAQFTVQVHNRDDVAKRMLVDHGIPTAIHYPVPLHRQKAYASISRNSGALTNAEKSADSVLSLPLHPYLDISTQRRVVTALLASL